MKKILTVLFIFQVIVALSQNTNITGTAIGHPDELVRILVYADQFSRLDSTLAVTRTDVWGNFSFPVSIDEPTYTFLALGLKRGNLYIDPGNPYQIQIMDDTAKGSVFDQIPLQFNLYSETDSLNRLIGLFNYKYNVFLYEKQREIMRSKDKSVIKEFADEMKAEFISEQESDNYIENYVNYSLAAIEWLSKSKSDTAILLDYFIKKKVLRENIAYTDFFRDYFKEYFKKQKYYHYDELVNAINLGSVQDIDSLLRRDKVLILNDELRELSLMLLLARHIHNQDVSKKAVYQLYKQIELLSVYDKNKGVARNFRIKLSHLNYGSEAPPFQLPDQRGEIIKLSDLKGQFVLLDFISSKCGPCFFDLKRLQEIQQNVSDKLTVILIVTDGNIIETKANLGEDCKSFIILNLNDNILLLEKYQVMTYPAYVLINPDGTIAMAPAPPPNENLDHLIEGFLTRYENK